MSVGERSRVYCPPKYAYGSKVFILWVYNKILGN